jgi:hypothetical protein
VHQMVGTLPTVRRGFNTLSSTSHFFLRYCNFLLFNSKKKASKPCYFFFLLNLNLKLVAKFLRRGNVCSTDRRAGAGRHCLLNINPAQAVCNPCAVTNISWRGV